MRFSLVHVHVHVIQDFGFQLRVHVPGAHAHYHYGGIMFGLIWTFKFPVGVSALFLVLVRV
jgi:hypothetical protein